MATQLQIRRGTTSQMNAFTGAEGELAVNTTTDTVHVHDGSTAGGFALAKADGSNIGAYAGSFTTLAASGAVTLSSTLTVSGNVGIGGAPSKPLHVFGADGAGEGTPSFNANTVSIFQNNGASGDDSILNIIAGSASSGIVAFGDSADSIRQAVVANMSDDSLELRTGNNSTALKIDAGGSVLIGKTTPTDLHNTWNHLIIGEKGAIISENGAGGIDGITLADNVYLDADTGGYAYQTTAAASIIRQTAGITQFAKAASGSAGAALTPVETMRIDESGNVIIGGSTAGDAAADNLTLVDSGNAGMTIQAGDTSYASLYFKDSASPNPGYIQYKQGDDFMRFATGGSERMRINSGGDVFIASAGVYPSASQTGFAYRGGAGGYGFIATGVAATNALTHHAFYNPNGVCGQIYTTGSSTVYATSSDYRLKENVVGITGATQRLLQLKPSRFNFIADANTTVDGFLAHEIADVVPEAIVGTKDAVDADGNPDYQGIDQSKLVPLLVATIQELEARLTALENN